MNDRELLELAAKASGLTTKHKWNAKRLEREPPIISLVTHRDDELHGTAWNPLEDDGDAFRLAVKLEIRFGYDPQNDDFAASASNASHRFSGADKDPRRIIVLIAAEIGKAMP
jgi:hypothetical protein